MRIPYLPYDQWTPHTHYGAPYHRTLAILRHQRGDHRHAMNPKDLYSAKLHAPNQLRDIQSQGKPDSGSASLVEKRS